MREPGWVVVVPVKNLAGAKSRLRGALVGVPHGELVLAMASDTVAGLQTCPLVAEVWVVTDDPRVRRVLGGLGARVVPDQPAAGLNAAVSHGATLAARAGGAAAPVAAVAADLPALRPSELAGALRAAARCPSRGFVTDAEGSGTTLLAARAGLPLAPCFGVDSANAHTASGARALQGHWPTLRRDVDTLGDLVEAWRLGLGRHTTARAGAGLSAAVQG